ncbi:hypothetical protein [uncultured Rikenella sp.]|uniref:hypothetical protein n=1 Tax=uncultured Rikenella sp. TaxID=368003 RepID=UPI0025DE2E81|nr:hypothetical protein [uncultured Rikenella sp.]
MGKTGAPIGPGNYGYSWSSTISGMNGRYLDFGTQRHLVNAQNGRAHGLQLRCLSE